MECSKGSVNSACECWKLKDTGGISEFKSPCSSTNCIYAYIRAGHTSFEQYKIQIENLYRFASTKTARPAADPALLKRAQEADETNNKPVEKRARIDEMESESSQNPVNFMSSKSIRLAEEFCPINRSPVETGYRNKAEFTIGQDGEGKSKVASPSGLPIFSESILNVVCHLQGFLDFISNPETFSDHSFVVSSPTLSLRGTSEEENQTSLKDQALALSRKLLSYDLISRSGHWSSALVRETRMNDRLLRVELHRDNLTDTLTELCCGLRFTISMDAFFQVNTPAAEILYNVIKERCLNLFDPPKVGDDAATKTHKIDAVLLDICCGTGTIGLCLAECFESVFGIELVPAAVENARHNAELNGITNAKFLAGRAELLLTDVIRGLTPDKQIVAILDPPRAGVHPGVIEVLRRCSRIRHLIFVACDLAAAIPNFVSLARPPSKKFIGDPFLPTSACCVDLFPQTPNIEVVVVLERLSARDCEKEH
ncbi:unnamed protein product [Schistocephalus solidus]|uniref:tRNA (uracil(54)-C(5))-methyltransferase n=1 Tax=Schistocephalus solidus TaxID=70667 RepID=A0A183T197_SCHSO|nr:unnamed protein product [Schistocephalus solidus]